MNKMVTGDLTQEFLENEIRNGQFRTNRRNRPVSAFLVTETYTRHYEKHPSRLRVKGVKVFERGETFEDDLDAASIFKMYPCVKFRSQFPCDDGEDK